MATAHEIALDLLRSFGPNVVARRPPLTYGQYAAAIGRDPAEFSMAVEKGMHAIGAICVIRQLPVAPVFWVRRGDDGPRGIFESDPLERQHIIETKDIDTMYVVAREYHYSTEEFTRLEAALQKSLASENVSNWSPHEIWHLTFSKKPKDSTLTYYQRAMSRYRELFDAIKSQRAAREVTVRDR
jgi:hypothetical protein